MTIHIVYNRISGLNDKPKANLQRLKRLHAAFQKAGKDCVLEIFREEDLHSMIHNHEVYIAAENYPGQLCWFVIYDDTRKRKYLTNESEFSCAEDIIGYFRTRAERKAERELALEALYKNSKVEYV
ncbi:TPA: hypothetical protein U1C40_001675 [Streptococcus suis]|nr:hypothetical protein [Streptococcus suis]HEM3649025.1 hypothetical protein [Streptococcus suis]